MNQPQSLGNHVEVYQNYRIKNQYVLHGDHVRQDIRNEQFHRTVVNRFCWYFPGKLGKRYYQYQPVHHKKVPVWQESYANLGIGISNLGGPRWIWELYILFYQDKNLDIFVLGTFLKQ